MDTIRRLYNYVFYEQADPRVQNWAFMGSPWPLVYLIAIYLIIIKIILPAHMKDRGPYNLRPIMKWYNVMQIIANAIATWGLFTSGWSTTYTLGCMLPDYSMDPVAVKMLSYLWFTLMLKFIELVETVFFLLRKKESQASFLHIYHHCSTMVMVWCGVKYIGGGITTFSPMINNAVHVIMYSYYLLSAEGTPSVKAVVRRYKKWLTVIQMVQFLCMFVHMCQVFLPSCPAPTGVACLFAPNVVFIFYMFYNFFNENYVDKRRNGYHQNGKNVKN